MKKTFLSLALAAAAMVPSVAQAQFQQTCWTPTTQDVCLAWQFTNKTATSFSLQVYAWGMMQPIRFRDIGVFGTGATGNLSGVTGVNVNVDDLTGTQSLVNLTGEWNDGYGNNLVNPAPAGSLGASAFSTDALIGPLTAISFGGVQTPVTNGSSYLQFNFTTNQMISDNSFVGFFAQGDGVSLKCFSDPNFDTRYECGPPTQVPEPASFGLVFAGLAGLAGVTALRRRNQA